MLTINDRIESIMCVPCEYDYRIDNKIRFEQIDEFVQELINNNTIYPILTEIVIMFPHSYVPVLEDIFPNLTHIGVRYVHLTKDITDQLLDLIWLNDLVGKYDHITLFLYVEFFTIKIRQKINRNPEIEDIILSNVYDMIKEEFPSIKIIHMTKELPSLMLAQDNWLFETSY